MVFDVASGQPTNENMNQADTMMYGCSCLRLSPDDKLVVSCSVDGSVRVSDDTVTQDFCDLGVTLRRCGCDLGVTIRPCGFRFGVLESVSPSFNR